MDFVHRFCAGHARTLRGGLQRDEHPFDLFLPPHGLRCLRIGPAADRFIRPGCLCCRAAGPPCRSDRCRSTADAAGRPDNLCLDRQPGICRPGAGSPDAGCGGLPQLSADGLVQPGSIYADMENDLVSYAYTCGAWGGVLLETPELENFELGEPPLSPAPSRAGTSGSAMVYYAFDDASSSTRYPYYAYMQAFWTALGLDTRMDSAVTVSDLRQMDRYDLCVLSAHGAYYTYQTGLLLRRLRTQPVILLTERSTLYKDLLYGFDLLCHRVIKVNGRYCITPDFFRSAYWGGRLDGTIVYSETCEFYGMDGSVDLAMADALLAGGAEAVVGFVNNVYAVYARSMLWATVNFMIAGDPVATAVQRSMDLYGTDDLIWYHSQGGRRPHAAAAYPLIQGRADAVLPTLPAPAPQQAA